MANERPRTAKLRLPVIVTFSDGTEMEFTHDQYAELVARFLVERCPDCPRFSERKD